MLSPHYHGRFPIKLITRFLEVEESACPHLLSLATKGNLKTASPRTLIIPVRKLLIAYVNCRSSQNPVPQS